MLRPIAILVTILCLSMALACAGSPVDPASSDPANCAPNPELAAQPASNGPSENRYLWGLWDMYWDPVAREITPVPKRDGALHLNIRRFLEDKPCTTCLVIGKNFINDEGDLDVEIDIRHPIDDPVFTGFDVRGIAIFQGTYFFKEHGLLIANTYMDEDEYMLVNADGYTELWSNVLFPEGTTGRPAFEYNKGTWAVHTNPLPTHLNGFITHHTKFNRRAFEADSHDMRHYEIRFPADPYTTPLIFGYSVDGSWAQPTNPVNPAVPDDFPIQANSTGAYRIDIEQEGVLTPVGGNLKLTVQVFDWQDAEAEELDTIESVQVESPHLFGQTGIVPATYVGMVDNHFDFEVNISNEDGQEPGLYPLLVTVKDTETLPVIGDILPNGTRSYQVFMLEVHPVLELEETVDLIDCKPIEAEFDSITTTCYFSPFPLVADVAIYGIDSALETVEFPVVWSSGTIGVAGGTGEVYIATDKGLDWEEDITAFDLNTQQKDHSFDITIPEGESTGPLDLIYHNNAQEMWITLYFEDQVAYFNVTETTPDIGKIDLDLDNTDGPTTLAIDQDSYTVFVACDVSDLVYAINGFSRTVEKTLELHTPLESPAPPLPAAAGMAYHPTLDRLYVATLEAGNLDYYDLADESFLGSIELAPTAYIILGVVYDEVTDYLFVTGQTAAPYSGLVWAIDPNTDEILCEAETTYFNPSFAAVDSASGRLFVPDPLGICDVFQINK